MFDFQTEKGTKAVNAIIKKTGIIGQLMEFFHSTEKSQQIEENFVKTFQEKNLDEVADMFGLWQ